jgi:peptidoglycan/xylan/chitin deacetylase (PgdA/CDA1 family)
MLLIFVLFVCICNLYLCTSNLIYNFSTEERVVALTFDEGPDPAYTVKLLEYLDEFHAKGTFFLLGSLASNYPDLVKSIISGGHDIGSSMMVSNALPERSMRWDIMTKQLAETGQIIKNITGVATSLGRPPTGKGIRFANAVSLPKHVVLWSVDGIASMGNQVQGIEKILKDIVDHTHPGCIIRLAHTNGRSMYMLPALLKKLHEQGYKFLTISELMQRTFK